MAWLHADGAHGAGLEAFFGSDYAGRPIGPHAGTHDADAPGIDVRVISVQRTGPIVCANATTVAGNVALTVELPHLHYDVPSFVHNGTVRLRLMQFSMYPRGPKSESRALQDVAPLSSGEQRERGRLG
ncbi:MAG: hypothetical protein ACREXM_20340 [Gammaproteobacteria bacterium]